MVAHEVPRVLESVNEFCIRMGVGRNTFYKEVKNDRIKVVKVGTRTLVPVSEEQAWLARLTGEAA